MALCEIHMENFSVFSDGKISLSPNINVFIGANGTGKTQLLKAVYGCCELTADHRENFQACFQLNAKTKSLARDKKQNVCHFSLASTDQEAKIMTYHLLESDDAGVQTVSYEHSLFIKKINAVYLPVKDMLTHSRGLLAMAHKYNDFPFDKTLLDSIECAGRWGLKQPSALAKSILPLLDPLINGTIAIDNDEFYIVKKNGQKINFELEAEGFKKIGILWQLLMNETITENTILLWDEPEANLNPEFLPVIADCLLALSRQHVQILISTHSYILAKYIEIRAKDTDKALFHSLYKKDDGLVYDEQQKKFSALQNNTIVTAFEALMDEIYMGKAGE